MAYIDILRKRARKTTTASALKTHNPHDVIIAPVLTEKAYAGGDSDKSDVAKKYFFKVLSTATKVDVKQAITAIYGVNPTDVNLLWVKEKGRSNRKLVRKSYKKAIVTIAAGEKLPVLDV